MDKRSFIGSLLAIASLPAQAQVANPARAATPALLTITGAIAKTNRGPFDPASDVLMSKHKLAFTSAYSVDWQALTRLRSKTIQPTLEYDNKPHKLAGPSLLDVLALAQARLADNTTLALRAIDGYAPTLSVAEARQYDFLVATHRDGVPLHLGGVGPLWAVYDADRYPDAAAKPVSERFAKCPWGLYHIEVRAA